MAEEQPTLGQLIWLVRRELEWVHGVDVDHPLRFDVGSVELDVAVEVARTTGVGGGLDLKVWGVGGSGEFSRESSRGSTTTVHVVLTPRDTRSPGGKFDVSALDTEPPPRRAGVTGTGDVPAESSESTDPDGSPRGARDIEPPPDR
ncbi:trypco2 family protein [Pseudarthrobacter sp. SSS035]|uniref:trypco2 family protein n=1 Tax=Pseudarthrobacter sp. SSS035 TaxID=2931399 RepID=UPI00200BF2A0|nr:trypco2 family protein [Pseudarthrobacter sp. SSS035]